MVAISVPFASDRSSLPLPEASDRIEATSIPSDEEVVSVPPPFFLMVMCAAIFPSPLTTAMAGGVVASPECIFAVPEVDWIDMLAMFVAPSIWAVCVLLSSVRVSSVCVDSMPRETDPESRDSPRHQPSRCW